MAAALIGGTLLTVGSTAWPVAWMGLELNLLGFVPLAMIRTENKKPAIYYFVVQSVGSLLLLFGGMSVGIALSLCLFGLLLKIGLAPMHFWVPPVAGRLSRTSFGLLLTWQKVAPLSLLVFITLYLYPLIVINVMTGSLMIFASSALQPLLVFRGLVQLGWVLALGGGALIWHYLTLYYVSLSAVIAYQRRRSTLFSVALLNAGGLPPMTGFLAKLRALFALPSHSSLLLLAGRGVALASYVRILLASKLRWESPPVLLLAAVSLGAV